MLKTLVALRQSEEQSRNILESIDDGFFALDENWRFTYVNQPAETLLDRTPGDLIGKDFWEEFPGLDGSEFGQLHRRVMRDRMALSLTAFYPDHDRHLERARVYQIVSAAAQRAGIQGKVSPHWLRHAHASHSLERGAPIHLVQATRLSRNGSNYWALSPRTAL